MLRKHVLHDSFGRTLPIYMNLFPFGFRHIHKMNPSSAFRFMCTVPVRTTTRRSNCSSRSVASWESCDTVSRTGRRWFSTGDAEKIPVIQNAVLSIPTSYTYNHDQRRNISTAELDKYRDTRERIVILGSGWAGYSLCRSLDHKKYQVVLVCTRIKLSSY
jgi:hypothetical protein